MWDPFRLAARLKAREVSSQFFCEKILKTDDCETSLQMLAGLGFPLERTAGERVRMATAHRPWRKEIFCFVDIETTGHSPEHAQVLEIGALKGPLGGPYEEFSTLVHARYIPKMITEVTGITMPMVAKAPTLSKALHDFKLFLGDSVFVAHDVEFDYDYLSASLERHGLGRLMNRRLCTLRLARKSFQLERYGLVGLAEALGLDADGHHRAAADARLCAEVAAKAVASVPEAFTTTEELIGYVNFQPQRKKSRKRNKESVREPQ